MAYDYTFKEKWIMGVTTGLSNFATLPTLYLMVLYNRHFEFFIGVFTIITSFLYHFTESIEYDIYMEAGKWHALDNIGSICCFNSLFISMMNCHHNQRVQSNLNLFSILFVTFMQAENPWDLFNTIFPILMFGAILIFDYIKNGMPKFNKKMIIKGLSILVIAVSMFVKGLDEHSDYLRIAHSLWHVTIAISTFYLWQVLESRNYSLLDISKELTSSQCVENFKLFIYDNSY